MSWLQWLNFFFSLNEWTVKTNIYFKKVKLNCKHFFVKPMSVLLHTFNVVLCKCLICVINKVNASRSAGTYIQKMM